MGRRLLWFNVVFLTVGIVALSIGGFSTVSRLSFQRSALTARGRVLRLERRSARRGSSAYRPVVEFLTRDEQEITFTSKVGNNPPAFQVDEAVTVLYDPEDPHDAYIQSLVQFWGGPLFAFLFGAVFAGIPSGILLAQARGRSRARWLKENGRRISTKFERVEPNYRIRINYQNPYRIISVGQDPFTNQIRVFQSYNLWRDPTPLIGDRSIDVLIDPNNPKRYWLDTDFLGDMAD
jgi:hypothetical protein